MNTKSEFKTRLRTVNFEDFDFVKEYLWKCEFSCLCIHYENCMVMNYSDGWVQIAYGIFRLFRMYAITTSACNLTVPTVINMPL